MSALRGVNLGGWLLLEKWMTPSLFAGTSAGDEYEFMQTPDAKEKIERHRKTFITERDFAWLQTHKINAVRIPIGYWALAGDAPFTSCVKYLDWAMDMAKKYQLQVIIDVHGLKGSQNGRDHSGKVGKAEWFKHAAYRQDSLVALEAIAHRYKNHEMLWGVQIINEPKLGLLHLKLRSYYRQSHQVLARTLHPHTRIIYSDAFTPRLLSNALGGRDHPVIMDIHLYHMATVFSQYFSTDWFMRKTMRRLRMLRRLSLRQPIIIGEWSGVMRHETTKNMPQPQQDELFREYTKLQMEVFSQVAGWFYWNYKTEASGSWNFQSEVEAGRIELK